MGLGDHHIHNCAPGREISIDVVLYLGCHSVRDWLQGDDYNHIMVEALADRLAEAFAEKLHQMVRKDLWGYAPEEDFTTEDLLKVKYQGGLGISTTSSSLASLLLQAHSCLYLLVIFQG